MNCSKQTILVVEDDRNIAACLFVRLSAAGYAVHLAHDADAGTEAVANLRPDLIILDIAVPAGGGFSVAERLRDIRGAPAPLIFITASRQPGLRERAWALGAAGFFEKPYDPQALLAAIRNVLNSAPSRRASSSPLIPGEQNPSRPASATLTDSFNVRTK